jgi:hypothetical protein
MLGFDRLAELCLPKTCTVMKTFIVRGLRQGSCAPSDYNGAHHKRSLFRTLFRDRHMGGVMPSLPCEILATSSVPSGNFGAAATNTFTPGLSSALLEGS